MTQNQIKKRKKEIDDKMNRLQTRYRKNMEKLDKELYQLQEICKHNKTNTIYHPDVSGNNDYEYECTLCGRWAKDLSKPKSRFN